MNPPSLEQAHKDKVVEVFLGDLARSKALGVKSLWGGVNHDETCAVVVATGEKAKLLAEFLKTCGTGVAS